MTNKQGWTEPKNTINKKGKAVAGRHSAVKTKKNSLTMAKPMEPESWEKIAKKELEKELGVKTKLHSYQYYEELGAIALESVNGKPGNNGEREWIVFPDSETAEVAALAKVREDLENEPELFTSSWIQNFIKIYDTDRRIIAQEESDNLVDEVFDEKQIITDADIESDIEEIDEQIAATDDIDELTKLEEKKEKLIEEAKEKVRSDQYDKIYAALEDPIEYFVEEQRIYSREDLLKQSFIRIDIDKAAQSAIDKDGVSHFLDNYDGSEVELPSGAVAYGTN